MENLKIEICIGSACFARGNARNVEAAEKYLKMHHIQDKVHLDIKGKLCSGHCAEGPNVIFNDCLYNKVTPEEMVKLLDQYTGLGSETKKSDTEKHDA